MSRVVLDASALLAFLFREPGKEQVEAVLETAVISSVNLSEVVSTALRRGGTLAGVTDALSQLPVETAPFASEDAYLAGGLWPGTNRKGLSLGDRCCLALGERLGLPVFTADGGWSGLEPSLGVQLVFIR